jgi:hypothetical protein
VIEALQEQEQHCVEHSTEGMNSLQQGARQQQQQQQLSRHWCGGLAEAAAGKEAAGAPPAPGAAERYGSCNGASDASAADVQESLYPSWCSSNCWSPLAQSQQQQEPSDGQMQPLKQAVQQQQECGLKRQPGQPQGVSGDACAAVDGINRGSSSADAESAAAAAIAAAAAAIPPSLPEVDFLEKIGRGSFGDVFKGGGKVVARHSHQTAICSVNCGVLGVVLYTPCCRPTFLKAVHVLLVCLQGCGVVQWWLSRSFK